MRFKINLKPNPKFPAGLVYDNVDNTFFDGATLKQIRFCTAGDEQESPPAPEVPCNIFTLGDQACTKERHLRYLEIVLGLRCNLSCSYCSQQVSRREGDFVEFTPAKIAPFIEHLKRAGITIDGKVNFWGGEPLVYWKTLKPLIEAMRAEFPSVKKFWLATNGTLLTKDKIDFFKANNVSISVSTDGTPQTFRGIEVESRPELRAVLDYAAEVLGKNFAYHTSPHRGSADLRRITEYLKQKTPAVSRIELNGITRCQEVSPSVDIKQFEMTTEDRTMLEQSSYDLLTDPSARLFDPHHADLVNRLIEIFAFGVPRYCIDGGCGATKPYLLTVDAEGNTYSCHCYLARSRLSGNIDHLREVRTDQFTHFTTRARCRQCHVASVCRGICPRMLDDAVEVSCGNFKAYYSGIFRATLFHLLGVEVIGVEALIPEPKPEL